MAEDQLGTVELLLVGGDARHLSLAPAAIEVGTVRLGGWQVHPVVPSPARFPGRTAYLVKVTFDFVLAPDAPAPPWVEVGFAFDGESAAVVMDAVPRASDDRAPARSYRVDQNLTFVEVAEADRDAVHLPEIRSTVTTFGAHRPEVRWRHHGLRPGSHTAWFVLLTASGVTSVDVKASVRYDLPLDQSFGHEPTTDPAVFHLDLVPGPATPMAQTIESAQPAEEPGRSPRVFISYAHEDSGHITEVLAFAEFLVGERIDVVMDRWDQEVPRDWYVWAIQSLREVDFVIVVASPRCKQVGEGYVDDDHNRGLQAEMGLIREDIYSRRSGGVRKYLPVVLPGGRRAELPMFLQPETFHHYFVTSFTRDGVEDLLRTLTGQPAIVRPAMPEHVPPLPPHSR